MIITTSSRVTIPRSPCPASPGCKKKEGVPVDASVDEIFLAIWPYLPIPIRITLPLQPFSVLQTLSKLFSILFISARTESASVCKTALAISISDLPTGSVKFVFVI